MGRVTCQHPDDDVLTLRCGYPLPCPKHTVLLDKDEIIVPLGHLKSEGPKRRRKCDLSSWSRVAADDGSTVAYVPDIETARSIIAALKASGEKS